MKIRPSSNKYSVGELLKHIAIICKADFYISNGLTEEDMDSLYSSLALNNLSDIKEELFNNFLYLEEEYLNFEDEKLNEKTTSYWGVTYSRYEWLLEVVAHIYHHRGQLHSMLVHCVGKDPNVQLFE